MENQLTAELGDEQNYLLKLLWDHICVTRPSGKGDLWPVWDHLARGLYQKFPTLENAADVLLGLPTIPCRRLSNGRYGLVWRKDPRTPEPPPDERIGLSIAGFASLAANGAKSGWVADGLVDVIASLARQEEELPSSWNIPAKDDENLENVVGALAFAREQPVPLSLGIIGPVLQREFATLSLADSGDNWTVILSHLQLRPYRSVNSAEQYLEMVCELASEWQPVTRHASPLTLVQTVDYLSYVLAADPLWGKGGFVHAPDLQAASSLVSAVSNRHEFEAAMNGLCTVMDQLKTPAIPKNVVNDKYDGIQPASQARLEYWLKSRLAESDGLERVLEAMEDLRAARRIRVENAHSNTEKRKQAIRARRRLGLPELTADWTGAWETIRDRVAAAFDIIRQEVQIGPPPATD